uniref:DnaJ heat shock protein family (Hsp40) member C2 n=1 Tax=Gadus morhua TaxID=8049 RepID=A0A8C5BDU9_GADMO
VFLIPLSTDSTTAVQIQVEPVGRWFEAFVRRRNRNVSASFQELEDEEEESEEDEDEDLQLVEHPLLRSLDPKDWKNQDHYAVLGIGHMRYKATQKQIKTAHKAIVLKHHPDKRKAAGEQIVEGDNDYFTCITKAIEVLSDPVRRRAFDSVDPTFDNAVPQKGEIAKNFFTAFAPVFDRNARWSSRKHVPKLGTAESTFEEVDNFYSFWYNLDSWREFSYLDEEEKEKAECRDERRWIDKQNRASRTQRKKEEMVRMRNLVDTAYSCDPRIKRFKEEEKSRKDSEKKAKADAKKKEQEDKDRARQAELDAARLLKEKEDEEAKQVAQLAKKEKEIQKKAIKKERGKLRTACKNWNYFTENESDNVKMMQEVEKSMDWVSSAGGKGWNEEDLPLLIKAVNLFPAGTNARWEVIANYMNLHSTTGIKRTAKDVINKAKNLQRLDPGQKDVINKNAFEKFRKEHSAVPVTVDNAVVGLTPGVPNYRLLFPGTGDAVAWTTDEQKLLEQALKTFPVTTAERWDRISSAVPGRSKKDCMKRYKELVEMVKAKKAAQVKK